VSKAKFDCNGDMKGVVCYYGFC